jgi:hypothetical protein
MLTPVVGDAVIVTTIYDRDEKLALRLVFNYLNPLNFW